MWILTSQPRRHSIGQLRYIARENQYRTNREAMSAISISVFLYHCSKFYSDYNEAGNFSVNSSEKQLNIASTFFKNAKGS